MPYVTYLHTYLQTLDYDMLMAKYIVTSILLYQLYIKMLSYFLLAIFSSACYILTWYLEHFT